MPDNKTIILGLVSTKTNILENADMLKRRIEEAAMFVDIKRLGISPQCGFASTKEGNKLSEENQWRKLERLVEVADEVWG